MMSTIRLDTDDLKDKSSAFHSMANAFAQSGQSLLDACNVSTPYANLNALARGAGNEMHAGLQDLSRKFTEHAEFLKETAEVFERADQEVVASIQSKNTDILNQTSTQEVINNPDGSVTTITIQRVIFPDGTIIETATIITTWKLDDLTALQWNDRDSQLANAIIGLCAIPLGLILEPAMGAILGLATVTMGMMPYETYAGGDTITRTTVITTTYLPDGTPALQDIKNTTTDYDKNGKLKFEEKTGIDSTGALSP
jgi:hypothetical protein